MAERLVWVGVRVKSGRAVAAVLEGSAQAPMVLQRADLVLSNKKKPVTWQPYHPVMDLPWDKAHAAVSTTADEIRDIAARALDGLVRELRAGGFRADGVGVAGSGAQDPARIGNPHVRAHAAEGRLFREVVESAAGRCGLRWRSFSERVIYEQAADELDCPLPRLKLRVSSLASKLVRPWGGDEKMAALAAWLVLTHPGPS
ncbi:MAG: hypothetical protein ACRD44_15410 [Bryobacteraceae bacterium]